MTAILRMKQMENDQHIPSSINSLRQATLPHITAVDKISKAYYDSSLPLVFKVVRYFV